MIATTLGDLDRGETLLRECLAIRESSQAFGPTHPETIATVIDLAETVRRAGRTAEAAALMACTTRHGAHGEARP